MIKIFRHYISRAYLSLFLFEFFVFYSAMQLGHSLRFLQSSSWYSSQDVEFASLIYAGTLSLANAGIGLYRRSLSWEDYKLLSRMSISFVSATLLLTLIYYLIPDFNIARSVLVNAMLFSSIGMSVTRFAFYKCASHSKLTKKILVFGTAHKAAQLIKSNTDYLHRDFEICACLPFADEPVLVEDIDIITDYTSILSVAQELNIDEIVIATDHRNLALPMDDLLDCKVYGVDIVDALTFYEREKAMIDLDNIYTDWFVFSDGFSGGEFRGMTKRAIDIIASLSLLAVSWPFMLIVAIAILIESQFKGPIFYRQTRVGEWDKPFEVVKFRSMRTDAEMHGAQWATQNDSRVTRVGDVIRKFRLDELPQIWNVLKGDMSFVGPRPERPEFVEQFAKNIPYYRKRHRVKPGITGWAQLCYPYGASEYDAIQKLKYDLYYVKNYSLFLDMTIIIHTVEVVLWGKGAR